MRNGIHSLFLLAALAACGPDGAAAPEAYRLGETLAPSRPSPAAAGKFREVAWEALIPKSWDPAREFRNMDMSKLQDNDPRADELLAKIRKTWDSAPVVSALNGQNIRIAGFAVPLERNGERVTEFLLVPYFGACIHTPPPPANQIIHVFAPQPGRKMQTFDTLWVNGTLETTLTRPANELGIGTAGYRMKAVTIEGYSKRRK